MDLIWLLAAVVATTGYYGLVSLPVERALKDGGFPGTVDLQLKWRAQTLSGIIDRWRQPPSRVSLALWSLIVDFGLFALYVTVLLLGLRFGAGAWPGAQAPSASLLDQILRGSDLFTGSYPIALAAGLFDAAENGLQLWMVKGPVGPGLARSAFLMSAGKWLCLGWCAAIVLLGLIAAVPALPTG